MLSTYGRPRAEYRGRGSVTLGTGGILPCDFKAVQLNDGAPILECHFDRPVLMGVIDEGAYLGGTLDQGGQVTATHLLGFRSSHHLATGSGESTSRIVFRASTITIEVSGPPPETARYALTNFFFQGTDRVGDTSVLPLVLPLVDGNIAQVTIAPVTNYPDIEQEIGSVGRGIGVTCHASVKLRSLPDSPRRRRLVDDLCFVLSLARGTKIQWIEESLVAGDGTEVRTAHEDHVTKAFTPLPVIDPSWLHRQDTVRFIEATFPRYLDIRDSYQLDRGTIDIYLDARSEGDFLEVRGVKVAVAIEALKDLFLRQPSCQVTEFILRQSVYNRVRQRIKDAVKEVLTRGEVSKDRRELIYRNLSALNRTAFKDVVQGLLLAIDLPIDDTELTGLVESRNQLIHTGRFRGAVAKEVEEAAEEPGASSVTEFFQLVAFLDRCFLRLLGYDGPWIDMSGAPRSKRRETVR